MANKIEEKTTTMRVPIEFENWIKEIQKEFKSKKGFSPSKLDIIQNLLRQFKGKFIL